MPSLMLAKRLVFYTSSDLSFDTWQWYLLLLLVPVMSLCVTLYWVWRFRRHGIPIPTFRNMWFRSGPGQVNPIYPAPQGPPPAMYGPPPGPPPPMSHGKEDDAPYQNYPPQDDVHPPTVPLQQAELTPPAKSG